MRHHLKLGLMLVTFLTTAVIAAEHSGPATAPAATQPAAVQSIASIKRLIRELAANNYPARDGARLALMGLKRSELAALREAVKQSLPLEPSQVIVLREIVTQVYLAGDLYQAEDDGMGFLGVHLPIWERPEDRALLSMERGVVVMARVPGFCAFRMLQDGDVLLSMTAPGGINVELSTTDQLVTAVRSVRAGEKVTFDVLRQGEIISVTITLDRKPLNLAGQIEEFTGRRAEQAEQLWERDFAPLLAEQLG
jgi:hypothetical protein